MIDFFIVYLPIMFTIEVSSEIWNCANPRPFPVGKYYMCEWDESDLLYRYGVWYLRPTDMHDNYFEGISRRLYWYKRGYDATKIRIKQK